MTVSIVGQVAADELHVATWNVRRRGVAVQPADRWRVRAPRIRATLQAEQPALLAVQEALPDQAVLVRDALGGDRTVLGRGRDAAGRDEACLLVVDRSRLEVLEWRQEALSDEPDRPGSRSWGNLLPRILVWARLRDVTTGAELLAVSTHLSVSSRRAQLRSAVAIRELVARHRLPVVVLGDMNAGERSATVRALLEGDALRDAWAEADERTTPRWGTFPGYRQPREGARRIDWILVGGGVEVAAAAIDGRAIRDGWASDHLAVHARLRIGASA